MTRDRCDEDLHAAFQAERVAERGRVPSYVDVAAGRGEPRRRRARRIRWLLLSGALATVVAGFWLAGRTRSARELELARRVMATSNPTGFLLETPHLSLLDSIPRFGMSVPGSPLRALDPGGPLGPPLTGSPRI
jgi:hypothetical protein